MLFQTRRTMPAAVRGKHLNHKPFDIAQGKPFDAPPERPFSRAGILVRDSIMLSSTAIGIGMIIGTLIGTTVAYRTARRIGIVIHIRDIGHIRTGITVIHGTTAPIFIRVARPSGSPATGNTIGAGLRTGCREDISGDVIDGEPI